MQVTVSPQVVTVTPNGGQPVAFNLGNAVSVFPIQNDRKQAVSTTIDPTGYVTVTQFSVRTTLTNGRICDIPMGKVTNQPTWTNDQTGALACQTAIEAAIP
jgi:hypothetical protein